VTFGKEVTLVEPSNLYECSIENGCFVGPFVEIQKGVKIGNNTKVQSHTFICELVSIGNDCIIGHGVMFINDLFPDGESAFGNESKWKSTILGSNVSIGSNTQILPVNICDNVVIGAGAVVTNGSVKSGIYVGNPTRFQRVV